MKKFAQTSLVDYLIDLLPQIGKKFKISPNGVQNKDANTLFSIWKESKNKIGNKVFKKPQNVSQEDLDSLQSSGFVRIIGDKIQITATGTDVIKTMILGDDRSSYEDNGSIKDYVIASEDAATPSKMKKQSRKFNNQWWSRF